MTKQPELPLETTTCAHCNKEIPRDLAVVTPLYFYCSERCATEHTMARIRREGL